MLLARVDGGVLVLPLPARYRGVTAQIRQPRQAAGKAAPETAGAQGELFSAHDTNDETKDDSA